MRIVFYFIFYYFFLYWYSTTFLSFSIVEVKSLESSWFLNYIFNLFKNFFSSDNSSFRLLPIFFSILSIIIYYKISQFYFKKKKDLYFNVLIFSLIPGFIISSVIINKSIILIFLTFLFIYFYFTNKKIAYFLLFLYSFVDYAFINLYFALIFYAIYKKDTKFLIYVLFLLAINANFFNYDIGGKPRGYFLDVMGTYFLIFSPLVFVYFLYTLYKGIFFKKDIIYFISAFTFLLSIILSFRQHIRIDDYAPFSLIYIIYMVKIFLNSYRVRLPRFRKGYKIIFIVLFSSLIIFDLAIFFNKYTPLYKLGGSFYFIKPLVKYLKKNKIDKINCNNQYLCKALLFYGIKNGNDYVIRYNRKRSEVSIFHKDKLIKKIDVSKLNTL